MSTNHEPYKRICCKLDQASVESLNLQSAKLGISKAKLLNKWISSQNEIAFQTMISQYAYRNFNFRVTQENYQLLFFYAKEHNTSISKVVRAIIFSNTNYVSNIHIKKDSENAISRDKAVYFYQEGRYDLVVDALEDQRENLSQKELSNLIQSYLKQAEYTHAISAQEIFQYRFKKYSPIDSDFYDLIVRGDINMYSRFLSKAGYYFSAAQSLLGNVKNRGLIGYFYCLKGEYEAYLEKPESSLDYYETALEYLDIINHSDLIIRVYIRIRRLFHMVGNIELKDKIDKRLNRLLLQSPNLFYKAWAEMDDAFYFSVNEKSVLSENITKSSISKYAQIRNIPGKYYGEDNLARLKIAEYDYDSAYKLLEIAERTESIFRSTPTFSYSKFYMHFIEAKHNLTSSLEKMQKVLNEPKVVYMSYCKYILNTTVLVYGQDEKQIDTAKKNLFDLSIYSANSIVRRAATRTLADGRMHAVR